MKFNKSIQNLIERINSMKGLPVKLQEDSSLMEYAKVSIYSATDEYIVKYNPQHTDILDHLVAHELCHVLRDLEVPQDKRKYPYSSEEKKRIALESMQYELADMVNKKGIPVQMLGQIVEMTLHAVILQLTNMPVDIQIEKFLYNEYPELREVQKSSLEKQQSDILRGLKDKVEDRHIPMVYKLGNTMSYAFIKFHNEFIGDYQRVLKKVSRKADTEKGDLLYKLANEYKYENDYKMIDDWANVLGMQDWYGWKERE